MSSTVKRQQPKVVISSDLEARVSIDGRAAAAIMRQLGISATTIDAATIYIDGRNYLVTNGVTYPNFVGRLRHVDNRDLRRAKGLIVRVSCRVMGKELSEEAMNHTLVHELEHVAQMDRGDSRRLVGHLSMVVLVLAGAFLGNALFLAAGWGRAVGLMVGGVIGLVIGYKLAPHEIQARRRSEMTRTLAIKRTN